jgi:hypothetical protein
MYCNGIPDIAGFMGLATPPSGLPRPAGVSGLTGIFLFHQSLGSNGSVSDQRDPSDPTSWSVDLAHEVGHTLGLGHPGALNQRREGLFARRQLMYWATRIGAVGASAGDYPWHNVVGILSGMRGCMIRIRQLPSDSVTHKSDMLVAHHYALQCADRQSSH